LVPCHLVWFLADIVLAGQPASSFGKYVEPEACELTIGVFPEGALPDT